MNRKTEGSVITLAAIFMGIVTVAVGVLLIRETAIVASFYNQLAGMADSSTVYVQDGKFLRNGSDSLTNECRAFVVTGDRDRLYNYFDVLNGERNRDKILSFIDEPGISEEAGIKLTKAVNSSDELTGLEYHAIALAALAYGYFDSEETQLPDEIKYYDFEPYENNVSPEEQLAMANKLIFSDSYDRSKKKIYEYIDDFVAEGVADVNMKLTTVVSDLNRSLRYQKTLIYVFFAVLLITLLLLVRMNRRFVGRGDEIDGLNADITRLKNDLNASNKERDQANSAKSVFLAGMSGAIRSPINSIIELAENAVSGGNEEKDKDEYLAKIDQTAHILLEQVNEILTLGRTETGMVALRNDPLNISNFIDSCTNIVANQLSEAGRVFEKEVGLILHPNVRGDELHLRQVILNIVDNAIKFTREGDRVSFSISEEIDTEGNTGTAFYHIEIEDSGIGMSERYRSHIFDSFHMDSDLSDAGLGIGMSITKRYVEMMGGSIDVRSELQKGTKFTLVIPMEILKSTERDPASDEGHRLEGSRILVAEDNELNMEITRKMLIAEGAEVIPAENGLIALSLFKSSHENTIDAILMDIAMPTLDGIAAAKEIRSISRNDSKTVPIIAMVASNTTEDISRLLEAGMNDYISKPVDVTQLVKTLMSAMRNQSNLLAERLEKALRDANTDALTGVKNRNAFEMSTGRIDVEIESGEPMEFAIVIFDVNGLKDINDNVGHDEGNKLLVNSCRLICRTFKRSPVFRIGGDEFVAILRYDDYETRNDLVGGLLEKMTAENYTPLDPTNVSFALGMAEFDRSIDSCCSDVFKRADAIMYEHKKSIKGEGNIR